MFDRASRLASRILETPIALLSLVDTERQFFKSATGLPDDLTGTPLSHSFCQYVVSGQSPLAVSDARQHPLLRTNGAVADLEVIAYLGVPVRSEDGAVLGSFCAIDHKPRDWTDADLADLTDLAAIVETEVALRRAVSERQLLVSELNHRVKNLFSVVGGIVRVSRATGEDARALSDRLEGLSRAHALIGPAIHADKPAETGTGLNVLLETLLAPWATSGTRWAIAGDDIAVGPRATTSLTLAFHELATNAAKYGALSGHDADATLMIDWTVEGTDLVLRWRETGTCPAADTPAPGGFGTQLVGLTLTGQLGGTVETTAGDGILNHDVRLSLDALSR
ncbi:MAG: GAF domain-containing protein [Rhodobacteraceae bacterium]|nr:GAF domain-containing protein [Paracoccaceae bacterium]